MDKLTAGITALAALYAAGAIYTLHQKVDALRAEVAALYAKIAAEAR